MKVIKRDGRAVDYDRSKIEIAITKANEEVKQKERATKTAFWRCQCFAPVVSAAACLISSRGLNLPHHITNAALLRGRWHHQKDKNRSPSAKNQTR